MRKIIILVLLAMPFSLLAQREYVYELDSTRIQDNAGVRYLDSTLRVMTDAINNNISDRPYYNFDEFGAVGDNATNNASAFAEAIDSVISTGKPLFIPPKSYYIAGNNYIEIDNISVTIFGVKGKSHIRTGQNEMEFKGVPGTAYYIEEDITKGRNFILEDTLAPLLEYGDVIEIIALSDRWGAQDSFHKGEQATVQRTNGDSIFILGYTHDDYVDTLTTVRKMNAGIVNISGITFEKTGLFITYCKNSIVSECEFKGFTGQANLYFKYSNNVKAIRNEVHRDTVSGHTYGIDFASVQNGIAYKNNLSYHEQAMIVGGWYPCRYIVYDGNVITKGVGSGDLDFHANLEHGIIRNNYIEVEKQGIYAKGNFITIDNNELRLMKTNAIGITKSEERKNDTLTNNYNPQNFIDISNNKIYDGRDGITNTWGIRISWETHRDTVDFINIHNNYINVAKFGLVTTNSQGPFNNYIRSTSIKNNYIETWESNSLIFKDVETGQFYDKMVIEGNHFVNPYYHLWLSEEAADNTDSINYVIIRNNIFESNDGGLTENMLSNIGNVIIEENLCVNTRWRINNTNQFIGRENTFDQTNAAPFILNSGVDASVIDHNLYINGSSSTNTTQANTIEIDYE